MKVIDLLNKIAKGEEVPKKIKYENEVYVSDYEGMVFYKLEVDYGLFLERINDTNLLNDEVEIIEEDTFEDTKELNEDAINLGMCRDRINQLIRNQKKIISKLDKE